MNNTLNWEVKDRAVTKSLRKVFLVSHQVNNIDCAINKMLQVQFCCGHAVDNSLGLLYSFDTY